MLDYQKLISMPFDEMVKEINNQAKKKALERFLKDQKEGNNGRHPSSENPIGGEYPNEFNEK